jgi:hypothetical protein
VSGPSGSWSRQLSPRHAEILASLVDAGADGRSAAGLAEDLFGDRERLVTVRAEMSRLRRALGGVLRSGPYRVAPGTACEVLLPADPSTTLPGSSAPVVQRLRHGHR